ncbi:hypothetical protein PHYBOEH_005830 [Phytophthora boehmeriae]|uniref:Uncharacterized protein n=1 Tax=Phytophthora boehmeriae TaxID=109152 RepID=A0A8T1X3C8_9STRA|nr:hypothetical protein PHYBOEH_005830 [Phytophthora boehmeriae]
MLDVCAHMQQLLQQAEVKGERPADLSFLPLSLSVACLLQQLPAGLAPPAGRDSLSFLQVDRLPQEELERRLASQLLEDPLCAFSFLCSVVRTTEDTTQSVVQAVVDALPSMEEEEDDDADEEEDIQEQDTRHVMPPVDNSRTTVSAAVHQRPIVSKDDKKPQTVAVASRATDPAGIMRRAVSRDVGDGSAVLEIMNKYPADERIQSHGVRALKGVIRNSAASTEDPEDDRKPAPHELRLRKQHGLDESDESEDTKPVSQSQQPDASSRTAIQMVIDKMKQFPESLALQQDGLLSLAEFAHQAEEHIAVITSSGGIISIVDAMASLPDDVSANMAGLSVLAHPKIAGTSK